MSFSIKQLLDEPIILITIPRLDGKREIQRLIKLISTIHDYAVVLDVRQLTDEAWSVLAKALAGVITVLYVIGHPTETIEGYHTFTEIDEALEGVRHHLKAGISPD